MKGGGGKLGQSGVRKNFADVLIKNLATNWGEKNIFEIYLSLRSDHLSLFN